MFVLFTIFHLYTYLLYDILRLTLSLYQFNNGKKIAHVEIFTGFFLLLLRWKVWVSGWSITRSRDEPLNVLNEKKLHRASFSLKINSLRHIFPYTRKPTIWRVSMRFHIIIYWKRGLFHSGGKTKLRRLHLFIKIWWSNEFETC